MAPVEQQVRHHQLGWIGAEGAFEDVAEVAAVFFVPTGAPRLGKRGVSWSLMAQEAAMVLIPTRARRRTAADLSAKHAKRPAPRRVP